MEQYDQKKGIKILYFDSDCDIKLSTVPCIIHLNRLGKK